MALQISTVANSIAALSVSGLTIKDIDEIPTTGDRRGPILTPLPAYVTNFQRDRDSFGGGSYAKQTVRYTVNYRLLYDPIGTERTKTLGKVAGLIALIGLIWDAVLAIDLITGAIDVSPESIAAMGVVQDAAGGQWYGCDLSFRVEEFVN